jgi:hypothetical protein
MKKLIFFLLGVFVFTLSCTKEKSEADKNNLHLARISNINPYDFIGQDHNLSLDYLAENVDILDQKRIESITYILEFYSSKYPSIGFDSPTEMENFLNSEYIEGESIKDVAEYYYNIGEMTNLQYEYFIKLDSLSLIEDISEFNSEINELEELLNQDSRFTTEAEKEWLWGSISVCNHSRNYWYEARTDENHLWHPLMILESSGSKENEPTYNGTWLGEAWADTRGYVRGFFRHRGNQSRFHNASNGGSNMTDQYVDWHTEQ